MKNAVEFGFAVNFGGSGSSTAETLVDDNRRFLRALKPPFTTLWVEDHFQFGERPLLECWTALCTYGAEFPHLKLGTIVLGQSYRNPAMTAKMAAVLQWMSGGRLIFGIGAGWKEDEYRAYGYEYPKPAVRVAQLDEAVQIIRKMWTETPASFAGKHYQIENAICTPKPNPVPTLMIGGGGEQLTMRVAAKYADWWNVGFRTPEEYAHKIEVLHNHCAKVGRDSSTLTLTYYAKLSIVRDPAKVATSDRQHILGGTPDMVAEQVQKFIDLGARHILITLADFPNIDELAMFQEEVIPRLVLTGGTR